MTEDLRWRFGHLRLIAATVGTSFVLPLAACGDGAAAPPVVAAVAITPAELAVEEDSVVRAQARVLSSKGVELPGQLVQWSSADSAIATVAPDGSITGVRDGATTITARAGIQAGTAAVTVRGRVVRIAVTPDSLVLAEPQSVDVSADVRSAKGTRLTNRTLSWTTSAAGIARMDVLGPVTARITGIGHGTISVLATLDGVTARVPASVRGRVARIALSPARLDFVGGQEATVVAQAFSSNGVALTDRPIVWTSSDPAVADMDTGRVSARGVGTATLTASAEGSAASVAVVVHRILLSGIGGTHTCAIVEGIGTYCWGGNPLGELGTGDRVASAVPRLVAGSAGFTRVMGGLDMTCATTSEETQHFCWGAGTIPESSTPTQVRPLTGLRDLALGANFMCGAAPDGSFYCLGNNQSGQLGNGSFSLVEMQLTRPVQAPALRALFTGGAAQHACGFDAAGKAWCWGMGVAGALGDGSMQDRATPVAVSGDNRFSAITTTGWFTCGQTTDDRLLCWGSYEGWGAATLTPRTLATGTGFTSLTGGIWHACGINAAGDAFCWGTTLSGALGNGVVVLRLTPYPVYGGVKWVTLSAGGDHTCGVTTTNRMYCWGSNHNGELGDGTALDRAAPTPVKWPTLPSP